MQTKNEWAYAMDDSGHIAHVCVYLTQGKVALVDLDDWHRPEIHEKRWCAHRGCRTFYAVTMAPADSGQTILQIHRAIMCPDASMDIDHINHDGLDNKRSNMRVATRQQNTCNVQRKCNNTSGHTGVYWHNSTCKWAAQIKHNQKTIHLGLHSSLADAIAARKAAEAKYFGEFAPGLQ